MKARCQETFNVFSISVLKPRSDSSLASTRRRDPQPCIKSRNGYLLPTSTLRTNVIPLMEQIYSYSISRFFCRFSYKIAFRTDHTSITHSFQPQTRLLLAQVHSHAHTTHTLPVYFSLVNWSTPQALAARVTTNMHTYAVSFLFFFNHKIARNNETICQLYLNKVTTKSI